MRCLQMLLFLVFKVSFVVQKNKWQKTFKHKQIKLVTYGIFTISLVIHTLTENLLRINQTLSDLR